MKGKVRILFFGFLLAFLTSCVTARKVNYMQEPDKHIPSYADTLSYEEYQLRTYDRLFVRVYSLDESVTKMYNGGGNGNYMRNRLSNGNLSNSTTGS